MTWRCDAPDQAHAFDTREQADAKERELLLEKPARPVVVWEMSEPEEPPKVPQRPQEARTAPIAVPVASGALRLLFGTQRRNQGESA